MGAVVLVLVVVFGIGAGTYLSLRSFLFNRLDQQLGAAADGVSATLFSSPPQTQAGVNSPQRVYLVALPQDATAAAVPKGVSSVEALDLAASELARLRGRTDQRPFTVHDTDGEKFRATVRVMPVPIVSQFGTRLVVSTVVIGLSTDEVDRTLDRLIKLEVFIGIGALVVAFAATRAGVRFGLRHLLRVTQTAKEVATELKTEGTGLDRRVEVHDPGTEVGELAESMNTLLATYETEYASRLASEERMRQFLADASHELRTPLTSIRGYAELARMQGLVDAESVGDNLARIEGEGTRMSRLVDDLLTLARSDGGATPQHLVVQVAELAEDAVAGARASFPQRQIEVTVPEELTVVGDPDQLLRVLRNLVTNACTYTRPDGPIAVRAYPDRAGVLIQVLDSGPGLPPEAVAHVFERFWRANKARTSTSGGSGLGLSIVESIVSAHGGTVRFDSTVETGSTVSVWLPSSR